MMNRNYVRHRFMLCCSVNWKGGGVRAPLASATFTSDKVAGDVDSKAEEEDEDDAEYSGFVNLSWTIRRRNILIVLAKVTIDSSSLPSMHKCTQMSNAQPKARPKPRTCAEAMSHNKKFHINVKLPETAFESVGIIGWARRDTARGAGNYGDESMVLGEGGNSHWSIGSEVDYCWEVLITVWNMMAGRERHGSRGIAEYTDRLSSLRSYVSELLNGFEQLIYLIVSHTNIRFIDELLRSVTGGVAGIRQSWFITDLRGDVVAMKAA
ncbi:hypothetical protein Tco_0715062 [Tanacetum coccineum]